MDDERLLDAVKRGEAWSGPAMVTALLPGLLGYAETIAGDMSPAAQEEAIERAVLKAVDRIDRFDPTKGTFPGWVRGFLRHEIGDLRRRGGTATAEVVAAVPEDPSSSGDPSEASEQETHDLTWALLRLSVSDQVIIALRDFEGLSYAQCAERIGGGVTDTACRVRHFRALRRLAQELEQDPTFEHLTEAGNDK
jgi:RNA polymerase sigma factor (sigma-70 family)